MALHNDNKQAQLDGPLTVSLEQQNVFAKSRSMKACTDIQRHIAHPWHADPGVQDVAKHGDGWACW